MSKKTTNRLLIILIAVGIVAIAFIKLTYGKHPQINTAKVTRGDIVDEVSLDGTVKAQKNAQLGFQNMTPGKIKLLTKKVGDSVKAGTLLAQMDNADLQAQYDQAVQAERAAQADLAQFQNNLDVQKFKLKSLKKTDASSSDKNAQESQISASENIIQAQQAKINSAQDNVKNMSAQIAKSFIRAPFDGVIAKQDVEVGEVVAPAQPIITLIGGSDIFEIEAMTSEKDIAKIKVGDLADVTLDAYGKDQIFKAQVSAIDPGETIKNGVSTYKVTLDFQTKDDRIKSGMGASAIIKSTSKNNVIEVPRNSVIEKNSKKYIIISQNAATQEKEITTGIEGSNNMIEVTSGIQEGDSIVL